MSLGRRPSGFAAIAVAATAVVTGEACAQAVPPPVARIDWISVRLVYETSGALSADMIGPDGFSTWNAVVGGAGAKEPARDVIVQVFLSAPPGSDGSRIRDPVAVAVTSERWGKMASRSFKAPHLFRDGKAARTVFVPNAACANRLTVSATIGGERRDVVASLMCGSDLPGARRRSDEEPATPPTPAPDPR